MADFGVNLNGDMRVDDVDAEVKISVPHDVVNVELRERSYEIVVGKGTVKLLDNYLPASATKVAVITQAAIPRRLELSRPSITLEIEESEASKRLATVERLCEKMAQFEMSRDDIIICVGGGVVTDTGGFAAAIYHRGISVIHVPTTLLGMVDAAIGGKTGVNIDAGKNLIGAFWQPQAVLCDLEYLETLSSEEYACGLGELCKYEFIGAGKLHDLPLQQQIFRAVSLKAEVVSSDEREGGRRAILNYGHTLAHALEQQGFSANAGAIKHGQAVAVGVVFAAKLAVEMGRIDQRRLDEHIQAIESYGLSWNIPKWIDIDRIPAQMLRDKKAKGSLTFVLDGPRGPEVVSGISPEIVEKVLYGYGK